MRIEIHPFMQRSLCHEKLDGDLNDEVNLEWLLGRQRTPADIGERWRVPLRNLVFVHMYDQYPRTKPFVGATRLILFSSKSPSALDNPV